VFECARALDLLSDVERPARGHAPAGTGATEASAFRVKVRVIRARPNWRLEAAVFVAKLPLYPRLGYRVGGAHAAGSGNRSGFQRLLADVIAPIHLAVVAEALHAQRPRGCGMCAEEGEGGGEEEEGEPSLGSWSQGSAGGVRAPTFHPDEAGVERVTRKASSSPSSVTCMQGTALPALVDGRDPRRESIASEDGACPAVAVEEAVGERSPDIFAKLLVTFRLDPRGSGNDFDLAPFLSLHYVPNLGCAAALSAAGDPDAVSANRLVGDQYEAFLSYCLTGQSGHHTLEHHRRVQRPGARDDSHVDNIGVLMFRKSQVKKDLTRSVLPVLGYMLWEFEDRDVVERFVAHCKSHTANLQAFIKAVDGVDTAQQALAAIRAVLEDGGEPSAIALLIFGHAWNPDKRWSRLTSSRILTQPCLDGDQSPDADTARGLCMNAKLPAEVTRSRTGRRPNEGFRHFEHILLSIPYEEVERFHPEWTAGLFHGAREILCKDVNRAKSRAAIGEGKRPRIRTGLQGGDLGTPVATPHGPLHCRSGREAVFYDAQGMDANDEKENAIPPRRARVGALFGQAHTSASAADGILGADSCLDSAGYSALDWGRSHRPALVDIGNAPGRGEGSPACKNGADPMLGAAPQCTTLVDRIRYWPLLDTAPLSVGPHFDFPITPTASIQQAQQAYIASPLTCLTPAGGTVGSLASHDEVTGRHEVL